MLHHTSRRTLQAAQRLIAKVAIAAVALSSAFTGFTAAEGAQSPFTDISGSYAGKEIEALAQAGIISGYEEGRFFPGQPITRAELAKILVLATGRTESANPPAAFGDVAPDSWYRGYVAALVEANITEGTSAATFSPDALVTREELAVLFIRAMGLSEQADRLAADAPFTDLQQVADWAKPSVALAHKLGFISGIENGDGSIRFAPKEYAQRQALALLAYSCWTRQAEFAAKAEELLNPALAPSPSPDSASGGKQTDNNPLAQAFRVIKAEAFDRNTVVVTLDKNIADPAYVKSFSFADGLEVTGTAVKTGTPTVVLTTGQQTPEALYRLYYDEGNTFIDVTGTPDFLPAADGDLTGIFKLTQADTVYGPLTDPIVINGSLYIDAPRVKLRKVKVTGSLIITEKVDSEAVYLEDVQVDGETLVLGSGRGGLHLTDTSLASLVVNNPGETVDIVAEKGVRVQQTTLFSSAVVKQILTREPAPVFEKVTISAETPTQSYVSLQGRFETVDVHAPVFLQFPEGSIGTLNDNVSLTHAEAMPLLEKAVISNGSITLGFSQKPETLTIADFAIDAKLGGKPFNTEDWTYDAKTGVIGFPALPADSAELLEVWIKAKNDAFAGHLRLLLSGFSGRVVDVNGHPAEGIRITFRRKTEKPVDGAAPSGEAVTDKNGVYAIRLAAGAYTGELKGESFLPAFMEASAEAGSYNRDQDASVLPAAQDNEVRIVLSWGIEPRDLDAHFIGASRMGSNFHTWYKERFNWGSAFREVELDVDDTTAFGPETTIIRKPADGHYLFYVHQYSGTGPLGSLATVKVYQGSQTDPAQTYAMPLIPSSKPYWVVFKMTVKDGGISFTAMNEFTDSDPVNTVGQLGNSTELRSGSYSINDGTKRIEKVPQGTTVEAFKQALTTADPAARYELYGPDGSTVRTGIVENSDIVVVTGSNGISQRQLEIRIEAVSPSSPGPAAGIAGLYASPDHSVTNAVYSQPIGPGANTENAPFHIPSSANYLLIQFNQELAASSEGLQVYANGSLVSADSVRLLPERLLALNVAGLPLDQDTVIRISGLKKATGNIPVDPFTVYISIP